MTNSQDSERGVVCAKV